MSFISIQNISRHYGRGDSRVCALSSVSFSIEAGEFVAVMGESGAGKSTLLSILGAMNTPSTGTCRVDGIDLYGLPIEKRADFRREYLGFIFQSFHLVPYLTVIENVMLPLVGTGRRRRERIDLALQALQWVDLTARAHRMPSQISGGEKERAAVARAIVNSPLILLADEPTGNLDSRNARGVMQMLQRLNNEGMTIVMVTHSETCAGYAGRLLNVSDGRLIDTTTGQVRGPAAAAMPPGVGLAAPRAPAAV